MTHDSSFCFNSISEIFVVFRTPGPAFSICIEIGAKNHFVIHEVSFNLFLENVLKDRVKVKFQVGKHRVAN